MDNVPDSSAIDPIDFANMDDGKIVDFIDDHFAEFSNDPRPAEFPRNIRRGLKSGRMVAFKHEHGFAVVAKNMKVPYKPDHAEIVFLFTSPHVRGQGIAGKLIEQAKQDLTIGRPIKLVCHGGDRHRLFTKHDFMESDVDDGNFEMWFPAEVASNPPVWRPKFFE